MKYINNNNIVTLKNLILLTKMTGNLLILVFIVGVTNPWAFALPKHSSIENPLQSLNSFMRYLDKDTDQLKKQLYQRNQKLQVSELLVLIVLWTLYYKLKYHFYDTKLRLKDCDSNF